MGFLKKRRIFGKYVELLNNKTFCLVKYGNKLFKIIINTLLNEEIIRILNGRFLKNNDMKKIFKIFRYIIFLAIAIAFILAISYSVYLYSVYLYNSQNTYFISWLNTLISTLISILLALMIAIFVFYYRANIIQKKTKNKFIPLIEEGLIDVWMSLFDLQSPMKITFSDGKIFCFHLNIFDDIIFEQAIRSNVFDKEETIFLLEMKVKIKFHNNVNEHFVNLHPQFDESTDKYRKSLEFLYDNYNKSRNELKSTILSANNCFKFKELDKEIKKNSSNV